MKERERKVRKESRHINIIRPITGVFYPSTQLHNMSSHYSCALNVNAMPAWLDLRCTKGLEETVWISSIFVGEKGYCEHAR